MPFTVDPTNTATPADIDEQNSGAAEIRGIKILLASTITSIPSQITTAIAAAKTAFGVPVGTIIPWAGNPTSIPANYLVIPHTPTTVSRTTYAALFYIIGGFYGNGDGITTFNLPYISPGQTLVNYDNATINFASQFAGQLQHHKHVAPYSEDASLGGAPFGTDGGSPTALGSSSSDSNQNLALTSDVFLGSPGSYSSQPNNLPAGLAITWLIKYQ